MNVICPMPSSWLRLPVSLPTLLDWGGGGSLTRAKPGYIIATSPPDEIRVFLVSERCDITHHWKLVAGEP